jgi:hypothetical protein
VRDDRYRWTPKKLRGRSYRREEGDVSGTVVKGGRILIEKKVRESEGGCEGHEAQGSLSRGSSFCFSDTLTGGSQPGQTRFDTPRVIHSASPRGFLPPERPSNNNRASARLAHRPAGPRTIVLAPLNQKKIDISGRNRRALPAASCS